MSTGKTLPPLLLVVGQEEWLRQEVIDRIRQESLAQGFEETDSTTFSQPPEDAQGVLEALRTLPMASVRRLVRIDGIDELDEKTFVWLADYLKRPNPQACLIVCAEKLGNFKPPKEAQLIACQPLKGAELSGWVTRRASQAGCPIEPKALTLLIQRVGSELRSLSLAIESLALLAGSKAKITEDEVSRLIRPSVRETAFDILDSAAAGKTAAAIESMRLAFALNRLSFEQFLGALGWYYRMAWKTRRLPAPRLKSALKELVQADLKVKLGDPAPEFIAERLLFKLSS